MKTYPNEPITASTETRVTTINDRDFSEPIFHTGLTKREYFAALAMQGILSDCGDQYKNCAESAIKAADALIEALNR